MASPLSRAPFERALPGLRHLAAVLAAFALPTAGGALFAVSAAPSLQSRYLPWIAGRSLGLAAYLCLCALVGLGFLLRHPGRERFGLLHAETALRTHAVLGMATVSLVIAHVLFLASDRYAGVGWMGAILPGAARYRPGAVALGIAALVLMMTVAGTARFAGRRGAGRWLGVHRLASAAFALVWLHGVLAGTDTLTLRPFYLVTGGLVVAVGLTRLGRASAPSSASRRPGR